MRQIVLRSVAGILAALFAWMLVTQSFPLRQLFGFIVVTVLFAAYAILGNGMADEMLGSLIGSSKPRKSDCDDPPHQPL